MGKAKPRAETANVFDLARQSLALFQDELRKHDPAAEELEDITFTLPGRSSPGMEIAVTAVLSYAFKGVAAVLTDRNPAYNSVYVTKDNYDELLDDAALEKKIGNLQEMLKVCWRKATDENGGHAWKRSFPQGTPEEKACPPASGLLYGLAFDWHDRGGTGRVSSTGNWSGKNEEPFAFISGPDDLQEEIFGHLGIVRPLRP